MVSGAILVGAKVGLDLYGGAKGQQAGKDAAKEAKKLAKKNSKLARTELTESLRVLGLEQEQVRSTTRARAAASGVTLSGSISNYLAAQQEEQTRVRDFETKAGEKRIKIIKKGGQAQARQLRAQGDAAFLQGVTGAVNTLAQWWK